jgi:hypothetical protein
MIAMAGSLDKSAASGVQSKRENTFWGFFAGASKGDCLAAN